MSTNNTDFNTIRSIISTHKDQYDYLMKILVAGPSNAGKTTLLRSFLDPGVPTNSDLSPPSQTIGVQFHSKLISIPISPQNLGTRAVKLQVWDTAGSDRFRSLTRSYYRASAGAVIMFDLSDRSSLEKSAEFMEDVIEGTRKECVLMLVGNKKDLIKGDDIQIRDEDIQNFINTFEKKVKGSIEYLEASGITGDNVYKVFEEVITEILQKVESRIIDLDSDTECGVQYGNLDVEMSQSYYNSQQPMKYQRVVSNFNVGDENTGLISGRRVLRRKSTTLSMIERSFEGRSNGDWCCLF